jgi:hypothetical protein
MNLKTGVILQLNYLFKDSIKIYDVVIMFTWSHPTIVLCP